MARPIKTRLFVLVLAFALVWIVVLAPASMMVRMLPPSAPLLMQGISGSVWAGAVAQATLVVDGQTLTQGRLNWDISPWSLLRLTPCAYFRFAGSGSSAPGPGSLNEIVAGVACLSAGGKFDLREVAFDLPAQRFLRSPDIRLGGEISGLLTTLAWQSGVLLELNGHGLWSNAVILSDDLKLSLNTLPFNFSRESGDSLVVQMDNRDLLAQQTDSPLHVSLQSTVALDGRFHTRAQLTTQAQTPVDMIELLNVLAEPQGADRYTLDIRSQP